MAALLRRRQQADALVVLRYALGLQPMDSDSLLRADVAPLDNDSVPAPDGRLSVADALVVLRASLGLLQINQKNVYRVTGTVPGTLVEAFCDDGSYFQTHSEQNGTDHHPFALDLPVDVNCRLVMTTNENQPGQEVVTAIRLVQDTSGNIAFSSQGEPLDLGHVPLALRRLDMQSDSDGDGVEDAPMDLVLAPAQRSIRLSDATADPMDSDRDGIIDLYEDDDHDGRPNRHDDDDDNDGIPDADDDDHDNDGRSDNDRDRDGIHDSHDRDHDNDGHADDGEPLARVVPVGTSQGTQPVATPQAQPNTLPADAGRVLAAQCFQCHGTDGRSNSGIESLAGEGYSEIVSEMAEMSRELNANDIMAVHAKGYTTAEVQMLATYIAGLDANRNSGSSGGVGSSDSNDSGGDRDDDHGDDRDDDRDDDHDDDHEHDSDDHRRDHDDD